LTALGTVANTFIVAAHGWLGNGVKPLRKICFALNRNPARPRTATEHQPRRGHHRPRPPAGRAPATTGEIPTADEAKAAAAGETSTFNQAVPTADEGVSAFGEAVATTVEAGSTFAKPGSTTVEAASTGDK
jgi:hypothetical protein